MNYLAFYTVDDATQTVHILKTGAANGSLPVFS